MTTMTTFTTMAWFQNQFYYNSDVFNDGRGWFHNLCRPVFIPTELWPRFLVISFLSTLYSIPLIQHTGLRARYSKNGTRASRKRANDLQTQGSN